MKIRVLLVAYACRPNAGTEYGVGWHLFRYLSQLANVHLITEAGYRPEIEAECEKLGLDSSKITFIDIGAEARVMCDRQGTWAFYPLYRTWQLEALKAARDIVAIGNFDLVHHLNMIGYREPGFMYKLGIPFVIGPLGGFGGIPTSFLRGLTLRGAAMELTKRTLNVLNMLSPRIQRAIRSANAVIAAVPESKLALRRYFGTRSVVIPETGCLPFIGGTRDRKNVVWVGKEVQRKMFGIAAAAFLGSELAKSEKLIVVGDFSKLTRDAWASDRIVFEGTMSQRSVLKTLGGARALLFPSVHEGNPHVVYEAIAAGTPVVCHDCYGMGFSITDDLGIKVPVRSYHASVEDFTKALDELLLMRDTTPDESRFRSFAESNNWSARAEAIYGVYQQVIQI